MNAAVVYYSLQGSTKRVAEKVAELLGASTLELVCEKPYPTSGPMRLVRGAKDAMAGIAPALLPYDFDAQSYDLVVVCGPLWAGKMAAPLNTFVRNTDLEGIRLAGVVVSGAPQPAYADALRTLVHRDAAMPVLHLTTAQATDPEVVSDLAADFCQQLTA